MIPRDDSGSSENPILEISRRFALAIIMHSRIIEQQRLPDIAVQLRRCATSVGANVSEAQRAQSRADFIHKMKLAQKELIEEDYWLGLCRKLSGCEPDTDIENDLLSLKKLFSAIISTAIQREREKKNRPPH